MRVPTTVVVFTRIKRYPYAMFDDLLSWKPLAKVLSPGMPEVYSPEKKTCINVHTNRRGTSVPNLNGNPVTPIIVFPDEFNADTFRNFMK